MRPPREVTRSAIARSASDARPSRPSCRDYAVMPSRRSTTPVLLVFAVWASASCDDPLRPEDVTGTYVLRAVRGDPVPGLVWQAEGASMRVLADTLLLNADGTGLEVWHIQFTNQLGTTTGRSERPLRFELHDDRLEGAYLCEAGAACLAMIEPLRGQFTRAGLRLDVGKHSSGPLLFERSSR